jgi:hypothetical protein
VPFAQPPQFSNADRIGSFLGMLPCCPNAAS